MKAKFHRRVAQITMKAEFKDGHVPSKGNEISEVAPPLWALGLHTCDAVIKLYRCLVEVMKMGMV